MPVSSKLPPRSSSPALRREQHLPREPQLFRFGLRRLFLLVTLLGILLTLLVSTSGPWPLVISMVSLLVAAHVLGALLGPGCAIRRLKFAAGGPSILSLGSDQLMTTDQPQP